MRPGVPTGQGPEWIRWIGLGAGPLAGLALLLLLPGAGVDAAGEGTRVLTPEGRATAAVGALMAVWWLTEAVPLSATALVPIALLPLLGARSIGEATAPYADPVIFLFMGGFILGLAMERWGLHRRIALLTIRLVGTQPQRLVAGFMLATAVMSMWVSNTATVVMMVPVGISVIHLVFGRLGHSDAPGDGREPDAAAASFATALMLGIAYAASIGGVGTLIGTPPNVILRGYVERAYGQEIGFATWLAVGLPLVAIFLPLAWLYLTRWAFPVRLARIPGGGEMIRDELRGLGPMTRGEWAVFAVFVLAALAWVLRPQVVALTGLNGLTDEGIAVILFGGGLSLAAAIQANGVDRFVVRRLHRFLPAPALFPGRGRDLPPRGAVGRPRWARASLPLPHAAAVRHAPGARGGGPLAARRRARRRVLSHRAIARRCFPK